MNRTTLQILAFILPAASFAQPARHSEQNRPAPQARLYRVCSCTPGGGPCNRMSNQALFLVQNLVNESGQTVSSTCSTMSDAQSCANAAAACY